MSEAADAPAPPPANRVRIWDGPTRIFHWAIVLLIPAMWWTAENEEIALHVTLGLVMVALIVFRLVWGLIGSSTARFATFLKGPRGVMAYLKGSATHSVGQNPLGGWSVAAMLLVLVAQVGLGLFAESTDGYEVGASGPLTNLVSLETAERLTDLHELMFNLLLALIALHIAAVLYYAVIKRRNLVGPMITGSGTAPAGTLPVRKVSVLRIAFALAVSAGVALYLWSLL